MRQSTSPGRRHRTIAAAALGLATIGCRAERTSLAREPGPDASFLARLEKAEAFAAEAHGVGLDAAWHGTRPSPRGLAPLLWIDDAELDAMAAASTDPRVARRVSALRDRLFALRMSADPDVSAALERLLDVRRRHSLGDQVALARALTESDAAVRRQAWLAQAPAARELAPLLRELARARREWARERHGGSFLAEVERHRGVDVETARRLGGRVAAALARAPDPVMDPWDVEASSPELGRLMARHLDEAGSVPRALAALELAGLPRDPPALRVETASDPRALADFASFAVDPPRDVRLRVAPGAGLIPQWSALHEVGHAAQALLAPADGRPLLRWPLSDAVSEGCAKVFERLAFAPEWLREHGVPEADVERLRDWEAFSERFRVRAILADTALEDTLYEEGFVGHAGWAMDARVRDVAGVPAWALHRTVAVEPRGRFDYLLARCAQAAIHRRLRALPGGLLGDEARRVLRRDVLEAAAGLRFEEWFERATGETPSCEAWLEDVADVR